ncbi:hypothetical protein [Ferruginibacter sp.]
MNWKQFTIAFVSIAMISFPQNIIGCGPDADPYDYYTSFFHQNLPDAKGYKPFYYTGYNFLYDENEPLLPADALAKEWSNYCGNNVSDADAKKFVNKFAWKDLNNLYFNIEKNQPLKIPDSVAHNSMTDYFIKQKDLEGLGYIMYAKQVEPYVYGGETSWDVPQRDSLKMAKLIKNGQQLYTVAKKDIFKLKFAYQVLRLAHYSGRYFDVIKWYDEYAPSITGNSVLQPMCVALKAGALFRTGESKEAAYLFSKAFNASVVKRISNYLGFKWSVNSQTERSEYLQRCSGNAEKAAMLGLFAIGSSGNEIAAMKEVYKLDAGADILEVLAVREINKLEEKYFSPLLQHEKGGKALYLSWNDDASDSSLNENSKAVKELSGFLHDVAAKNTVKNPGLFETGAAYTAYMLKDYSTAKKYLAAAEKMKLSEKVKDQWALTNLLVTINEKEKIDAAFEEQLLPSILWLYDKAKKEKAEETGYYSIQQWKTFYRNLMSEIMAQRYHQQGDLHKEALAIGAADAIINNYTGYAAGVNFLRNKLVSKDVEKLYALIDNKQANKLERFIIDHSSVTRTTVIDFAGTAYLRDYNYANAISWFKRSTDKKNSSINTNPFIDLLYDQEEALPNEVKYSTTKLAFAEEMLRLEKSLTTDKANLAKNLYKMANGFYNMTYYGHAWLLVQYDRSGSDGYYMPKDATAFEREYYGCFKAQEYFEKAMNASTDKNFKARCLFMMAKCSQKQLSRPQYDDYQDNYQKMEVAEKKYFEDFMNSKYFPQLVKEYGNTAFYKQAWNSCSYLRDFVQKK